MLSHAGRLIGDFTVSCLSEVEFQLTASYASQDYHLRWFEQNLSGREDVQIENVSDRQTGFQIAGPNARMVLESASGQTSSNETFPFLSVRRMSVGSVDCLIQRVSYTGDLGYEIYCDVNAQTNLWETLWSVGQDFGMLPFGMRAMMSLRLDRFFGSWQREFSPDYTAAETGLDRFISFTKSADFIGRKVAESEQCNPPNRQLCVFEVDAMDADVVAWEPIWLDGKVVGFCTSGGYSHWMEKSIAYGLVERDKLKKDLSVEVEILGEMCNARLLTESHFDPEGKRMRS